MFIDILQKLCNERGISVYKATTEIGLNRSAVAKWKKGAIPNGETLQKMAQFLGVDVNCLLEEKSPFTDEAPGIDRELEDLLYQLKNRPDMRLLFNLASNAKPEDVMMAVKIIEALKEE